jgi:hypothetical protein
VLKEMNPYLVTTGGLFGLNCHKDLQIGSGDKDNEIIDDDIMYMDSLVCILKPEVKKGIIVFSGYVQPQGMDSLYNLGLKSGKKLHEEGVDFGRTKIHPYIFFKAPYYSNVIDYTTVKTEIASSYGEEHSDTTKRVFIRVDPNRTFTFSSEIRVKYFDNQQLFLDKSKKSLSDYLKIINNNKTTIKNVQCDQQILYNLFSSEAKLFPKTWTLDPLFFDKHLINRNSEILVSIPHLTSNYFVKI